MTAKFRPIPTADQPWFGPDGKPLQYEYLFGLDKAARQAGGDAATLNGQAGPYYLDWANFTDVPASFPPSAHTHAQSDITGLASDLAAKQPLSANLTAFSAKTAPTGAVVGLTDAQALTNKDLTSGTNTFPTFNQSTTGSAAKLTTARNIDGQAFDGTANITVIAPGTHAATSKTTPVDADELPIVDSAASNVLKKLTWANLKATLKSYFDALYSPLPGVWTSSTSAVGSTSGTITTSSGSVRYSKIGKTVDVNLTGSISNNGTGSGLVTMQLPFAVASISGLIAVMTGAELGITGKSVQAFAIAGSTTLKIAFLDFTYPGASGAQFNISGRYEID